MQDAVSHQVHIVQSTGRTSIVQLFSIFFSLVSLTLASSRAFFIQRGQEEADPSPSLHMILKVFPYMLIQVTGTGEEAQYRQISQVMANVVCWSVISMLKEYLFIVLGLSFVATMTGLTLEEKFFTPKLEAQVEDVEANQEVNQPEDDQIQSDTSEQPEARLEESVIQNSTEIQATDRSAEINVEEEESENRPEKEQETNNRMQIMINA